MCQGAVLVSVACLYFVSGAVVLTDFRKLDPMVETIGTSRSSVNRLRGRIQRLSWVTAVIFVIMCGRGCVTLYTASAEAESASMQNAVIHYINFSEWLFPVVLLVSEPCAVVLALWGVLSKPGQGFRITRSRLEVLSPSDHPSQLEESLLTPRAALVE